MVQLMKNGKSESRSERMPPVKMEVEDPREEEHRPLQKRAKIRAMGGFEVPASQYNPLAEPSPLGLRLRKSPSLLELIQMKLSQANTLKVGSHGHGKKEPKGGAASGDKLKASNFPASILRIGTWEYKSRYEGDLVAKCYFAKHKLVWEVLDGGLKNKIEFQWSDIMALKANYSDDGPGTFDVVLARQPLFFRETNPQPRKHTLWQATADFTGGQASIHRRHHLECPLGLLGKHFEKLIQCDPRLNILSQQGEITLDSPYFEPRQSVFDDQNENNEIDLNRDGSPSFFTLHNTNSSSGVQSSSSKNDQDSLSRNSESYPRETPSPSSAMPQQPQQMKPQESVNLAVLYTFPLKILMLHLICGLGLASAFWMTHNFCSLTLIENPAETLRVVWVVEASIVILVYSLLRHNPDQNSYLKAIARGFLGLPAGAVVNALGAIVLGAPVGIQHFKKTVNWSLLMSTFTFVPAASVFGQSWNDWHRIFSHTSPVGSTEFMICVSAHGAVIGAWFGAWPMPLDWERPWQEWPICVTYGATSGYIIGMVVSFGFAVFYSRQNRVKSD